MTAGETCPLAWPAEEPGTWLYHGQTFTCPFGTVEDRVVEIRVERLNNISDEDCLNNGIEVSDELRRHEPWEKIAPMVRQTFAALYDSIHGPGSWERNPIVWVLSFKKVML